MDSRFRAAPTRTRLERGPHCFNYRWAEGRSERYTKIAADFVRLKVDVIVTGGNEPTLAAKQVTSVISIVFGVANDPLGTGLVASLARPGGNVTGLSGQAPDLAGKASGHGFHPLKAQLTLSNH
jgi:ABC-type uncharacterized transport system substrate-binding protein